MSSNNGNLWLVVGLGNPGQQYEGTRHNIGREAVRAMGGTDKRGWQNDSSLCAAWRHCQGLGGEGGEADAVLALPNTYMNNSGDAVRRMLRHFRGASPERVVAVCDDINLPLGRLRVRGKGSDGGQLGLRSIIGALGGNHFARVRIGVALPQSGDDLCDYVLSPFGPGEREMAEAARERAGEAVRVVLGAGVAAAMDRFNGA